MTTKIGHFEILSELAKSATATVYKANDPQSGQTIALKAIRLSAFGEHAKGLEAALLAEAESTKCVSSPNIVPVFGAGEIEGQFCAAMEYVQGNSVSTMLAHKEGFSIWDLLDIGRQVCNGLDHANSHKVFHYSLEPAKIMCGWDGTVKILGFGVSSVGKYAPQTDELPAFLHYMSPEQLRGEPIDARSNLFSLGAMFYEMVTERKPFEGPDLDSICQAIVEGLPTPPIQLNAKIHPLLSQLIMTTLEKDPGQRYQSGRELLDDLEKCKESKAQPGKKHADTPAAVATPVAVKAAAQSKFIAPAGPRSQPPVEAPAAVISPAAPKAPPMKPAERPMASAAASGNGASTRTSSSLPPSAPNSTEISARPVAVAPPVRFPAASVAEPQSGPSTPLAISRINTTIEAPEKPSAYHSAAVEEPVETYGANAGKIALDPLLAQGASRVGGTSFSEISELPPLEEIYVESAPPPPPPAFAAEPADAPHATVYQEEAHAEEKQTIQPREVAQKAIREIRNIPPRLMLYSIAGATALILVIGIAVAVHIHDLNSEDDSGAARPSAAVQSSVAATPATGAQQPHTAPVTAAESEQEGAQPRRTASAQPARGARGHVPKSKTTALPIAAPVVIPGQMVLDSTPQGAQAQIDGRTDPSYVTPFLLSGLAPGQHTVTVSKPGYSSDTRSVEVTSANKTSLVVHLAQLMATLSVTSSPAGANIFIDGRDVGKTTPAQVSVDKGQHIVLIRKMGFIDETATPQFVLGQTVSVSPVLRPLGNADSIKTVGKMKKLFGGSGAAAGQLIVSIKTQPKGAQVTINQHMLEKDTPVEVGLDPGNYVVDITLSGYAPIHKVITADKGSKLVVDEIMQKQ
jgi:eukaryotic-like serine/threonine-protein kinase